MDSPRRSAHACAWQNHRGGGVAFVSSQHFVFKSLAGGVMSTIRTSSWLLFGYAFLALLMDLGILTSGPMLAVEPAPLLA